MAITVQVAQRGVVTLPKTLRDAYNIRAGDVYTIIDVGGGSLLLKPGRSRLDDLLDDIRADLEANGESLESMLNQLRAERDKSLVKPSSA
jgi:AbrB family looped-hinge helix DNA binding protein